MIRVAIVEDQDEIRTSLQIILDSAAGFKCVGCYGDCESALPALAEVLPDVVLMDIQFRPGRMSGIEGVRRIKTQMPEVDILMLTVHADGERIFESLRAGACGYLLKHLSPAELLGSIAEVVAGGSPMSPQIARRVVGSFQNENEAPQLTFRQRDILLKLRQGKSYRVIGEELFISENTVKCHIKKIYALLHVHTQAEAIARAYERRLL